MIVIKYTKCYQHSKIKKPKINNTLIEKYKSMLEFADFEQNCYSIIQLVFIELDITVLV